MLAPLTTTLATLLLVASQTEAHSDRSHFRHGMKHRLDRQKARTEKIETEIEFTTVMVTVTVEPVPVDPTTVFQTVTDVVTGIFPPGASGSGTGTVGTGFPYPTGGIPSNQTDALPTFTRPSSVVEISSTASRLTEFPVFTNKPVIDISGTGKANAPSTTKEEASSSLVPSLTSFPVFSGSPVISIPTDEPTVVAPSTTDEYGAPPAVSTFPAFTDAPVVVIPSDVAPESSSSVKKSTSSAASSALTFPPFTGAPVITVPTTSAHAAEVTSSAEPVASAAPSSGPLPFLKGVNLGGWLVLEKWMTEDLFSGAFSSAIDQYTFDSLPGSQDALQQHWSTFFTESDISTLAAAGFNALRIPIGYWAYDNDGTPYHSGADAFLEDAIVWARKHSMKVLVDCHGSPGSQNGFDNSGEAGSANWQQEANLQKSIDVLKVMAKKYGSNQYADVVIGLQMVNEPISWGNNNFDVTKSWTEQAYSAVKAVVENPDMLIVMHDAFQGGVAWESVSSSVASTKTASGKALDANAFAVDEHLYQLFTDSFNAMNQDQHIAAACAWGSSLAASTSFQKTIVGEFSAATNICLMSDGTTTPGTSCSEDGCECQSGDWTKWSQGMKDQMRKFVEAQLEAFEANSAGYFAWSAKAPGGWGVLNLLGNGVWPENGERKFAGVCGGSKRDVGGRSMRRGLRR